MISNKIIWQPTFHELKRLAVSLARQEGIKPVSYNVQRVVEKLVNKSSWKSLWLPLMDKSQAIPVEPIEYFNYTEAEFEDTLDTVLNSYDHYRFYVSESMLLQKLVHKVRRPNYVSQSGSEYYYTREKLFRLANHWNSVASCNWTVNFVTEARYSNRMCCVRWCDIKPVPKADRKPFYLFKTLTGPIRDAVVEAGLMEYCEYFGRWFERCSYEQLEDFIREYKNS